MIDVEEQVTRVWDPDVRTLALEVLWEVVDEPIVARLDSLIGGMHPGPPYGELNQEDAGIISLVAIPATRARLPQLVSKFEGLPTMHRAIVMSRRVLPYFVPHVAPLLAEAGGWRMAEALTRDAVLPYGPLLSEEDLAEVLRAWAENSESRQAGGMLALATELYRATAHLHGADVGVWRDFLAEVRAREGPEGYYQYTELELAEAGDGTDQRGALQVRHPVHRSGERVTHGDAITLRERRKAGRHSVGHPEGSRRFGGRQLEQGVLRSEVDNAAAGGGANPVVEGLRQVLRGRGEVGVSDMVLEPIDGSATLRWRKGQQAVQRRCQVGPGRLAPRLIWLAETAQRRVHTQMAVLSQPLEVPRGYRVDELELDRCGDQLTLCGLHRLDPGGRQPVRLGALDASSGGSSDRLTVVGEAGDLADEVRADGHPRQRDGGAMRADAVTAGCLEAMLVP